MVNFLLGLLTLIAFFLLLLSLPINIFFKGSLKSIPDHTRYTAQIQIGGKRFGVMINFIEEMFIGFGPYEKPWFQWTIHRKLFRFKKTKSKKGKSSITFPVNTFHNIKQYRSAVFSSIKWKTFSLSGVLQLDNPMYTGLLFGGIHTIANGIPNRVSQVTIQPGFQPMRNTNIYGSFRMVILPISLPLKLFQLRLNSNYRKDKS